MHITMIKKQLENGQPCRKCLRTEDLLVRRGLRAYIDEVVWAVEGDPASPGWTWAEKYGVEVAPFFVVRDDRGNETVYTSALVLIREVLTPRALAAKSADAASADQSANPDVDVEAARVSLADAEPADIVRFALERFGSGCALAFSGAEDVVLIDMAFACKLPFSVLSLDTGRLHPETYTFLEQVRDRYGIDIDVLSPEAPAVEALVREKGLFSFYRDGHGECCGVRKVAPLERGLSGYRAWMTGQRRDQNTATRADVPIVQTDARFRGRGGTPLVKFNPLAGWTSAQVWAYIRERDVPYNALHERGYISIGCAPCTRAVLPGQPEREGRWWWEQTAAKECGLHVGTAKDG